MQASARLISHVHPTFHLSHPTLATFAWNTLLRSPPRPSSSLDLYRRMRLHSIDPDFYTFPYLLHAFSSPSRLGSGMATHAHILASGFASDRFVQTSLIGMYVNCGCLMYAHELFDEIAQPDLPTWNAMVNGVVRTGLVEHARRLFEAMPERNVVSWSCLIDGFVKVGKCREAIELFREMQDEGVVRPNEFTMSSVFAACGQLGALEHGSWAHAYTGRRGLGVDVVLGTSLIDMYAKCGSIEKAKLVFSSLGDQKDVMAWDAMISELGMHGKGRACIDLFERMQERGLRPNDVTLLGVLCGCAHEGLVEEGEEFFQKMINDTYGVIPKIQHYGCMVDLYGRAGLIDDAW